MTGLLALVVQLLSGETLLQGENCTGRKWCSNLDFCRPHGHCCKDAKAIAAPRDTQLINYINVR